LLAINDERFLDRAEVISEKGTNRWSFVRGEVKKYEWVDIGSSFMPSELTAAFLYAQLESIEQIQAKRVNLWETYYHLLKGLEEKGCLKRPNLPAYATNNAHIYYVVLNTLEERTALIHFLKEKGISSAFHFLSLNKSRFYQEQNHADLINSDKYTDRLLRLPMYYELTEEQVNFICEQVELFFRK
jgi:dTDP-4-amino-4,6-dideoxygalactose transaminase